MEKGSGPGCGLLFVYALATYVVLLVIAAALVEDASGAFLTGAMLGPVLLSTLAVGLMVRFSGQQWPGWLVAVAIAGIAGLLSAGSLVALHLSDSDDESGTSTETHRLIVPDTLLGWEQAKGKADQERMQTALDQMQAQYPDDSEVVGGLYESSDGPVVFIGVNLEPGGEAQAELQSSPEDAVRSVLDGMGAQGVTLHDAGELGGSLGCGTRPGPTGGTAFTCAWVDDDTLGTVTFPEDSTSIVRASADTLAVREAVTVVDG